ncbi:MAG: AAA family ATPase [Candidatus Aminicenantes bacterium]
MLVIVSGLPGTGKTTVAKKMSDEMKAVVLSTDRIRKKALKELGYSERKKKRVYDEMLRIAQDLLKKGENVILDGTFFRKELRERGFKLGQRLDQRVFLVETVCPEETVKKRIEERYKHKKDYSEANYKVYKIIQSKFDPFQSEHFVINTQNEEEWKEKLLDAVNKMRVIQNQEEIIDKLLREEREKVLQTHISWVILTGKNAYKVKKPVRFSFVDYSSLEKRKHFCEEENRINSLLSPDMYLGTMPIKMSNGKVILDGEGETVEYAVKMKELPQEARMDHLLKKGKVGSSHVEEIARILARFHAQAEKAPQEYGSIKAVKENFSPVFETKDILQKFLGAGKKMENIEDKVNSFLKKNKNLLNKRRSQNKIRHCHGDVRTKNIFLYGKKIYIFDAVEFNQKISCCDVAAEVAFLSMDLNFFSQKEMAEAFVEKYIQFSKDKELEKLIDFYQCYRALVETLVESYTLVDAEIGERKKNKAKQACQKYLDLAFSFAQKLRISESEMRS